MKPKNKNVNAIHSLLLVTGICFSGLAVQTIPVITDMSVISGERGTAATIKADASITASVVCNGKEVTITVAKAVYGLEEFNFSSFTATSPIAEVKVTEKKGSEIRIVFAMKETVEQDVKTVYKDGQFMALLSRKPTPAFSWSANAKMKKSEPVDKPVAVEPVKPAEPASLTNVRLLERDKISELAFEFDRKVSGTVKRSGNSITLSVDDVKNALGKNEMKLPQNGSFGALRFQEKNNNISIVFTIDTSSIDSSLNIAFTQGEVLSVFITKRSDQKATLWTSGHGLAVDHTFYNVPSYSVDMNSIGKRAKLDAAKKISKDTVFAIKVENNAGKVIEEDAVTEPPKTVADNGTNLNEKPDGGNAAQMKDQPVAAVENVKPSVEKSVAEAVEIISMKVTAKGVVNLRKSPSLKSVVCGKIKNGDVVQCVKEIKEKKWTKVVSGSDTGYVVSSFVKPTDEKKAVGQDAAARIVEVVPPESVSMTKVSTTSGENSIQEEMESLKTEPPVLPAPVIAQLDGEKEVAVADNRHKLIQYHGTGRDPFRPIESDSVSSTDLPMTQNLTLVGVLVDDVDRIALCEDAKNDNKPYTLREHDPVFKGRVLKIYKDKIVFLLTEYGISRSYTLSIMNNKSIMEASKK